MQNTFDKFGRCNWDEYFMAKAFVASQRSIDPDTKHGCVLIDENRRIMAEGYNGPPAGANDDLIPLTRPLKYVTTYHAEASALDFCSGDIYTAYITGKPCHRCLLRLVQRKVKRVIYGEVKSSCVDKEDEEYSELILSVLKPEKKIEMIQYKGLGFLEVLNKTIEYAKNKLAHSIV